MRYHTRKLYERARRQGYDAQWALRIAKTAEEFKGRDDIRIRAEPEEEGYFDVYGEPDGYTDIHGQRFTAEQEREQIVDSIERDGCWCVIAEWLNPETDEWELADSVGMCIYNDPTDPVENCYVAQLMRSALDAAEAADVSYAI